MIGSASSLTPSVFSGVGGTNTLIAFEQAIQQNCDGIELDIQYHHSDKFILLHDSYLKNGRQVDALRVKLPPSDPILEENHWDFDSVQAVLTHQLDFIHLRQDTARSETIAQVF